MTKVIKKRNEKAPLATPSKGKALLAESDRVGRESRRIIKQARASQRHPVAS